MTPREYYMLIRHALPEYHRNVIDCHLQLQELERFFHEAEIDATVDEVEHYVELYFTGGGYVYEKFVLTRLGKMVDYYAKREETDED